MVVDLTVRVPTHSLLLHIGYRLHCPFSPLSSADVKHSSSALSTTKAPYEVLSDNQNDGDSKTCGTPDWIGYALRCYGG